MESRVADGVPHFSASNTARTARTVLHWGPSRGHIDAPNDVSHVTSNGTFSNGINAFGWDWSLPHVNASASHEGQETIRATSNETFDDTANAPDEDLPSIPSIATGLHVGPGAASAITSSGHVNGERYACTYLGCLATFTRSSDLRRHAQMHSPARLQCHFEKCDRRFYRVDKLREHLRRKHEMAV